MDKLAINWQNFAQVGLQLKFDFGIRLLAILRVVLSFVSNMFQ